MVSDHISFNGNTRVEVITVLANCGRDTDRARLALVTWIQRKQAKGRTTEHILTKLRDLELKFIKDTSLHNAFRDARAETYLPKPPDLPLPSSRKQRTSFDRMSSNAPSIITDVLSIGPSSAASSPSDCPSAVFQPMSPSTASQSPNSAHAPDTSPQRHNTSRRGSQQHPSFAPPVPSPRIQIPRAYSLQPAPRSPTTSSSPESDARPRYRHMSQPIGPSSPVLRRVTPPRTNAPTAPLPPIPTIDQNTEPYIDTYSASPVDEQPETPPRAVSKPPQSPVRPLRMHPIPSRVLGSDESRPTALTLHTSFPRYSAATPRETMSSDEVVGEESAVHVLDDNSALAGIGAPPPYVDEYGTYTPLDMSRIGDRLDMALKICGESPGVRQEVIKCLEFYPGYEPPYWQSRLQACNLTLAAILYLVDEMSQQVDWSRLGRAI